MGSMRVGELLKVAREVKGMTVRDLERATGISNALLSQIETGHIKSTSFVNVVKIARALSLKLDTIADLAVPDLKQILRKMRSKGTGT